jgi:hypothetical protein
MVRIVQVEELINFSYRSTSSPGAIGMLRPPIPPRSLPKSRPSIQCDEPTVLEAETRMSLVITLGGADLAAEHGIGPCAIG